MAFEHGALLGERAASPLQIQIGTLEYLYML